VISVANIRGRRASLQGSEAYVGRANPRYGLAGSPLANPFAMKGESERASVIAKYADWLDAKIAENDGAVLAELDRLSEQLARSGELRLFCWCAPRACHADAIARVVLSRARREERGPLDAEGDGQLPDQAS